MTHPPNEFFKPSAPMVNIYVGQEREQWVLPEQLLCNTIPYFRSAFQGGFKEGREKSMELPEDNPAAFGLLIDMLLRGSHRCDCTASSDTCPKLLAWVMLYVMVDKFNSTSLSAGALARIRGCTNRDISVFALNAQVIKYVYGHSANLKDLRQVLVQNAVTFYYTNDDVEGTGWLSAVKSDSKFDLEVTKAIRAELQSHLDYHRTGRHFF